MLLSDTPKDFLPSWNEGKAKDSIYKFVELSKQTPINHRIATFDQDGTLWVEHPIYTQMLFAIDIIKEKSLLHPEWKNLEPYKTVLEGSLEKMKQFKLQDIEKIVEAAFSGISVSAFKEQVNKWLLYTKHPRFNVPFTDLTYLPMQELIDYLKENDFQVYIVTGGGQDFVRSYSNKVYGIPNYNIIGTAGKTKYEYNKGNPTLTKTSSVLFIDDHAGKPEAINLFIGQKPIASFGNSDGDREMLEWSSSSTYPNLQLLIHHDDAKREYAYDTQTKIGTFSESLKNEAAKKNWIIVSMKNDWKQIFKHP